MFKLHGILFVITFFSVIGICFSSKNSYTAAVVNYVHIYADDAKELFSANVEEYVKLMHNVSKQYADIIVFPEYGIVDIAIMYEVTYKKRTGLDEYSIFVPDPELQIAPCDYKEMGNFSVHLVHLSCAARDHDIYTVINLLEKAYNNETGKLKFHNTNVIFDRNGAVIARHRKIHLSAEPFLQPGDELVTFKADFGVTFGIFTCFDILFQYPALDILSNPKVNDIIFPTAWNTRRTFLQALSVQHGYAKANGVNFLAAGLQWPNISGGRGGSAIFLVDGTASYIASSRKSTMIIQEIPIIKERTPANRCMYPTPNSRKKETQKKTGNWYNINGFPISGENIRGYTFEPLITNAMETYKQICSEDKEFCCTFNITVDWSSPVDPDSTYKMGIFNGLSNYGSDVLGGIRICALLVCTHEIDDECDFRINTSLTSLKFKSIEIVTTVNKTSDTYYQPSTLRTDLAPVSDYTYCEKDIFNGTKTLITMSTTAPQDSLITFGIYGRVYSKDETATRLTL